MKELLNEIFLYDPQRPMLFNSGVFMLLITAFLLLYNIFRSDRSQRFLYLVAFGLFFYYRSSGWYFLLLIVSAIIDYNMGHLIERSSKKLWRMLFLLISILFNLGVLAYFKYTNFFIDNLNLVLHRPLQNLDIFLPAGISFFTFQNLSYSIDIYRKQIKPLNHILDYGFFVCFFPQLLAGPIVRAHQFIPQMRLPYHVSKADLSRAFFLIMGGLVKKAIISDYISVNFVDRIFDNPTLYSGFENLMGVYGYAIQIYCDFSGYSDIAIGLALLLGFKLPENFNLPYQASSITDFWRRWHISLSSWLRDYLYIPLGGNRVGKFRQYFNLFVTMLLGGLWHGASWNFVIWGALHGMALALHKLMLPILRPISTRVNGEGALRMSLRISWKIVSVVVTFHFVAFCWIFFRSYDFNTAFNLFSQIGNHFNWHIIPQVVADYHKIFLMMLLGYALHLIPNAAYEKLEKVYQLFPWFVQSILLFIVIWLLVQIRSSEIIPFIYFQF